MNRIGPHRFAYERRESLRALAEVDRLRRHHDPDRACRADHFVAFNARMIAVTIPASAPWQIHTFAPASSNPISGSALRACRSG